MALEILRSLQHSHRDDKDSGEALVEHTRGVLASLDAAARADRQEALADLASSESTDMSGVALEVLVREGQESADLIYQLFRAAESATWRDQLALALARLRSERYSDALKRHISGVLDAAHSAGATELAYLHLSRRMSEWKIITHEPK